jgi:hypothetical protein
MKLKLTFNDALSLASKGDTIPLIPMIKFYRAITGEGLKVSKDAICDMRDSGKKTLELTPMETYDKAAISQYARVCGLNVSLGKYNPSVGVESTGSITILSSGEVKFDLTNGPDHSLRTVIPRKQAGRVLDTFLQTTQTKSKRKGVHRKGPKK